MRANRTLGGEKATSVRLLSGGPTRRGAKPQTGPLLQSTRKLVTAPPAGLRVAEPFVKLAKAIRNQSKASRWQ